MRITLILILLLSFESFACNKEDKSFHPFAVEIIETSNSSQKMKFYELLSPIQKGENFLSSVTASVDGEFSFALDIHEDFSYKGDYYRSYLNLASKHIDQIRITLSYNTTKKDRTTLIFCANWKVYTLTELLNVEPTEIAPPPPPRASSERADAQITEHQ